VHSEHDPISGNGRERAPEAVWLLVPEDALPDRWAMRAIRLSLVRLLPEESEQLLEQGVTSPALSAEEEGLARLVALGMGAPDIAEALHMTPRSVYRRLARMRKRFGARNSTELAAMLAKQGF
jgi:DNA-binding NarL/FixJ family response regulator